MDKKTIIRPATADDIPSIHKLVAELAAYERAPDQLTIDAAQYARDFSEGLFSAFVLELEDLIVGTTIFYLTYSTWKGKMVYLEDFIISGPYRNRGLGTRLFDHFIEHCREIDAKIVRWQVLDWNTPAIAFYRKYPVEFDPEWLTVKWTLVDAGSSR